jgi:hypothetical protein
VPHFPADNGYGPLAAFAASRPPTATRLLGARAAMDDATFDSVVRSAFTPVGW